MPEELLQAAHLFLIIDLSSLHPFPLPCLLSLPLLCLPLSLFFPRLPLFLLSSFYLAAAQRLFLLLTCPGSGGGACHSGSLMWPPRTRQTLPNLCASSVSSLAELARQLTPVLLHFINGPLSRQGREDPVFSLKPIS